LIFFLMMNSKNEDSLPNIEPIESKVLPPIERDENYHIHIEEPCWFLKEIPITTSLSEEKKR